MSFLTTNTATSTPQNTPSPSRRPSVSSTRSWQRRNAVTPETLSSDSLVEAVAANDAKQQRRESETENQHQQGQGSEQHHQSKRRRLIGSIRKGWKDHHQSVQGSYEVYYGMGHRY